MAQYIKILNNNGYVIIDDAYQNYHLFEKKYLRLGDWPNYLNFNLIEVTFQVSALRKPLVAYRSEPNDPKCFGATYNEIAPNTWVIRVFLSKSERDANPNRVLPIYIYGLIPLNSALSTGAVLQIRNANNERIFDSGKHPMRILSAKTHYISNLDMRTWSFDTFIPDYSPSKQYAIVASQFSYENYYIGSGPGYVYYDIYAGCSYRNVADPSKMTHSVFLFGRINDLNYSGSGTNILCFHSYMIINVTGI